jgi:hypothetical protein
MLTHASCINERMHICTLATREHARTVTHHINLYSSSLVHLLPTTIIHSLAQSLSHSRQSLTRSLTHAHSIQQSLTHLLHNMTHARSAGLPPCMCPSPSGSSRWPNAQRAAPCWKRTLAAVRRLSQSHLVRPRRPRQPPPPPMHRALVMMMSTTMTMMATTAPTASSELNRRMPVSCEWFFFRPL